MEIIEDGLKLRQEIMDDARKKAKRIIKNTEKEIQNLETLNEEQKNITQKNYENQYTTKIKKNKNKILSSIKTELQKNYIIFAGKIIDGIYTTLKNEILSSKRLSYINFIKSIIKISYSKLQNNEIIVGLCKNDFTKINIADIVPADYSDKIKIIEDIHDSGVIIYSSDKRLILRYTIPLFMKSLKEKTRTKIYNSLLSDISLENLL